MVKKLSTNKELIIILLFGFLFRLIAVNQSLWLDEAIGAIAVKQLSYKQILSEFMIVDNHPPLYYLLLKLFTSLFGYSELGIRMLTILSGLVAILFTYKVVILIYKNKSQALFTSLFLSSSQFFVYYTQEARMYALTSMFSVAMVFFLLKTFKDHKNIKYWLGYSISVIGLVFSDYLPVFFLPVVFVYVLYKRRHMDYLLHFIAAHLPLLVLGLAWLPIFQMQLSNGKLFLTKLPQWKTVAGGASLKHAILVWTKFSLGRISLVEKKYYYLLLAITSLIYLPIVIKKDSKKTLISYLLILPLLLTFLASIFFPAFIYFRFTYLYPFFAIFVSVSIFSFKEKYKYLLACLVLFVNIFSLSIYYMDSNQQREDWKNAVLFVEQSKLENPIVLFSFSAPPAGYQWYENKSILAYGATDSISADKQKTEKRTRELISGKNNVYYFEYLRDLSDPSRIVEETLKEQGFSVTSSYSQFKGGVGQIYLWQRR